MGSLTKLALVAVLLFAAAPSLAAPVTGSDSHWSIQPNGQLDIGPQAKCWSASSNTAMSITGDICLSASKITFGNGKSLALTRVADNPSFKSDMMGNQPAEIFKVDHPATLTLLNTNTFEAQWIVVFSGTAQDGGAQGISFDTFDGAQMPADDTNMTGSYGYDPK